MTETVTAPLARLVPVSAAPALLPAVNLVPPEYAARRARRRVQLGLVAAVLAALGIVVAADLALGAEQRSAQQSLDTEQAQASRLRAEAARYAPVTTAYDQVDADRATMRTALGSEVRFSRFLADLSATIPAGVQISTLTVNQGVAAGATPGGSSTPASPTPSTTAGSPAGTAGVIGTLLVSGVTGNQDDVATWLRAIAKQSGVTNPYFTTATLVKADGRSYVKFDSTASLTGDLLSNRFSGNDGGLP